MKFVGSFPAANLQKSVIPGSRVILENGLNLCLEEAVVRGGTFVGNFAGARTLDTDITRANVDHANMTGAVAGITETMHLGKQRRSMRLTVAATAVRTVEDLEPGVTTSTSDGGVGL
jgi:hypothetical protein